MDGINAFIITRDDNYISRRDRDGDPVNIVIPFNIIPHEDKFSWVEVFVHNLNKRFPRKLFKYDVCALIRQKILLNFGSRCEWKESFDQYIKKAEQYLLQKNQSIYKQLEEI